MTSLPPESSFPERCFPHWPASARLDEVIDAFERAWSRGEVADLSSWLPSPDHPQANEIAKELFCIDCERRFHAGTVLSVAQYWARYPDWLDQVGLRSELAFEEYRLRWSRGERPAAAEYRRWLQISTQTWPTPDMRAVSESSGVVSPPWADDRVTDHRADAGEPSRGRQVSAEGGLPAGLPAVGERVLDFETLEILGRGSFGQVYLARQLDLAGRRVVLKMTSEEWSDSEQLARLQHANIVPVYSVHRHGQLHVLCMPFRGRATLRDVLGRLPARTAASSVHLFDAARDQSEPSSLDDTTATVDGVGQLSEEVRRVAADSYEHGCLWLAAQICAGLQHAHAMGLVHRDIKPANILLAEDGRPMILDFNLALDRSRRTPVTEVVGGTLPYMSPEQRRSLTTGAGSDERSDLYSLGCVLHELLCGTPPRLSDEHDSAHTPAVGEVVHAVARARGAVRPLSGYSAGTQSILAKCLAASPADRYPSAEALGEDLRRQLNHLPLRFAANRSLWERIGKWSRRHPRLVSASGVGLFASILLTVTLFWLALAMRQARQLSSQDQWRAFEKAAEEVRLPLSIPEQTPQRYTAALAKAASIVSMFPPDKDERQGVAAFQDLSAPQRLAVARTQQELLFLMANAHLLVARRSQPLLQKRRQIEAADRCNRQAVACGLEPTAPLALAWQRGQIDRLLVDPMAATLDHQDPSLSVPPEASWRDRHLAAVLYVLNQDMERALPLLTQLCRETPADFGSWFLKGFCHGIRLEWLEAETCFTTSVALWPTSELAYFQRGICRFRLRRLAAAAEDFSQVLDIVPGQAESLVNRGLVRLEIGDYPGAQADLTAALAAGRDDAFVYLVRARAFAATGDTDAAWRDLEVGLQREPVDVAGWTERSLHRLANDPEGALHDLNRALELNPFAAQALQNRVHLLADRLNRPDEAAAALDEWLKRFPQSATAVASRALFLARRGERDEALAEAFRAVQLAPSADVYYQVGCVLALTAQDDAPQRRAAVRALSTALTLDPMLAEQAGADADLHALSGEPAFQEMLRAAGNFGPHDLPSSGK